MTQIAIEIPEPWRSLFDRAPAVLDATMDQAIHRSGEEGARRARREAPKAFSTLTQSIRSLRVAPLTVEVAAGVDYAPMVEQGTGLWGPRGRPSGRLPPIQSLEDWIRVRRIQPDDPSMDTRDLAFVIGRSIANRGTPAQPFMHPAFEWLQQRAPRLVRTELRRGLREAGL